MNEKLFHILCGTCEQEHVEVGPTPHSVSDAIIRHFDDAHPGWRKGAEEMGAVVVAAIEMINRVDRHVNDLERPEIPLSLLDGMHRDLQGAREILLGLM